MTSPTTIPPEPTRAEIRSMVAAPTAGKMLRETADRLQAMTIEQTTLGRTYVDLLQKQAPQYLKDASAGQVMAFARTSAYLGLNPLLGECYLLRGGFYVSVHGRRKLAQLTGHMEGVSAPRMPTKAEHELYGIHANDVARIVEVYRKGWRVPAIGVGIIREGEIKKAKEAGSAGGKFNLPTADRPEFMAEKRATVDALKKAFPDIDVPVAETRDDGGVDIIDVPEAARAQLTQAEVDVAFSDIDDDLPTGDPAPPEGHNDGDTGASGGTTAAPTDATAAQDEEEGSYTERDDNQTI